MAATRWSPGTTSAKEAAQVRRSIALTGQFASLDESLTGRENLVLFGRLLGLKKKEAKLRATELLEHFNLVEAADKRVRDYSGGMRRRIDIACGLVTWPSVVFLDEPTTGLDPRSRQDVWSLIETLRDNGVTTLLTTQYLEEADMLADNIVVIDRGRVIAQGTANELKARTGNAYCDVTRVRHRTATAAGYAGRSARTRSHTAARSHRVGTRPDGPIPSSGGSPDRGCGSNSPTSRCGAHHWMRSSSISPIRTRRERMPRDSGYGRRRRRRRAAGRRPDATDQPLGQWLALSHRGLIHVMKNGEVIFAIISPLLLAVCFYVPLRRLMDVSGINYAQFLMPIILLQSIGFTGSTAAMRVTLDMDRGISTRFRALPIQRPYRCWPGCRPI